MVNWELDDTMDDEDFICECGVVDDLDDRGLCRTCAAAPHGRDCPCDECESYWADVAARSNAAYEAHQREGQR